MKKGFLWTGGGGGVVGWAGGGVVGAQGGRGNTVRRRSWNSPGERVLGTGMFEGEGKVLRRVCFLLLLKGRGGGERDFVSRGL